MVGVWRVGVNIGSRWCNREPSYNGTSHSYTACNACNVRMSRLVLCPQHLLSERLEDVFQIALCQLRNLLIKWFSIINVLLIGLWSELGGECKSKTALFVNRSPRLPLDHRRTGPCGQESSVVKQFCIKAVTFYVINKRLLSLSIRLGRAHSTSGLRLGEGTTQKYCI